MTARVAAVAAAVGVNGPEDESLDWDAVDWRAVEDDVRRLRHRIFKATQAGDWAKVRNLQKLMLRSRSNALVSVRRVTQHNAGRKTAGVDGEVVLTSPARAEIAGWVHQSARHWQARPVRRVYIPKAGNRAKLRPLGIPVIADRCLQALTVNALEPEWEARFEPRSYGFRPGRSCQDAIAAIYQTAKGKNPKRLWVLDADLAAAFDKIDHSHVLTMLGKFPAKELIGQWLKAGVVERGCFTPTEEGVPQGGVISPLLLNVALHGLEEAAGVRYARLGNDVALTAAGSPVLVRYADDLLALCHSRAQAEQVKARLAEWLTPRGLVFNEDKTRIAHLSQGCDFLGFNVRRYHGKLLIKPSPTAIKRIKGRLGEQMRAQRGNNAAAVPRTINPIVRGWAQYYRTVVASEVFSSLDHHVWRLAYNWARRAHPNKSKHWVTDRYFGLFHPFRQDRWVFGDRESGSYLHKFAWTKIVRHELVTGTASPDDPALADYWAKRRRKSTSWLVNQRTRRTLHEQQGRCPLCRQFLLYADHEPQNPREWEQWLGAVRKAMTHRAIAQPSAAGPPDEIEIRLVHVHCLRRHEQAVGNRSTILHASAPERLA